MQALGSPQYRSKVRHCLYIQMATSQSLLAMTGIFCFLMKYESHAPLDYTLCVWIELWI